MDWVNKYIGMEFKDPEFTCWDLVVKVYREVFNINLNDFSSEYEKVTSRVVPDIILREALRWQELTQGDEKTGDIIVLRVKQHPWHVGIVVSPGIMLHCEQKTNTCIEKYMGLTWGKKIIGFYRYDNT
ncbi:MAG: hypothetical protein DRH56_10895 [Deltaproteobacteria bacterium]|nr:MAG: hypothetical protein DRH56_10895 [Deltaproteobacteria bacterium]